MPGETFERLSRAVNEALERAELRALTDGVGLAPAGSTPDELAVPIRQQLGLLQQAVREGKLGQEWTGRRRSGTRTPVRPRLLRQ